MQDRVNRRHRPRRRRSPRCRRALRRAAIFVRRHSRLAASVLPWRQHAVAVRHPSARRASAAPRRIRRNPRRRHGSSRPAARTQAASLPQRCSLTARTSFSSEHAVMIGVGLGEFRPQPSLHFGAGHDAVMIGVVFEQALDGRVPGRGLARRRGVPAAGQGQGGAKAQKCGDGITHGPHSASALPRRQARPCRAVSRR